MASCLGELQLLAKQKLGLRIDSKVTNYKKNLFLLQPGWKIYISYIEFGKNKEKYLGVKTRTCKSKVSLGIQLKKIFILELLTSILKSLRFDKELICVRFLS